MAICYFASNGSHCAKCSAHVQVISVGHRYHPTSVRLEHNFNFLITQVTYIQMLKLKITVPLLCIRPDRKQNF